MSPILQAQQAISQGDFVRARALLEKHVKQHSNDLDGLFLLGICEQSLGKTSVAQAYYTKIVSKAPHHFGAHYNLGLLLSASGDDRGAMTHHDAAIRLDPKQYWAYINRGNAKARLKEFASAISDFQAAQALQPAAPESYTNLGNALREQGHYGASLEAHENALRLRPDYLGALLNKASSLIKLKRANDALQCLKLVLTHEPGNAQAWSNQGSALHQLKRLPEAAASFTKAIDLEAGFIEARVNRGNLYVELKQLTAALSDYELALQHDPHLPLLIGSYLNTCLQLCQWDRFDKVLQTMVSAMNAGHLPSNPFDMLSCMDEPQVLLEMTARYIQRMHPSPSKLPTLPNRPHKEKIRLGYFSSDFHTHPVALLLAELFELHDKSKFELIAFSSGESKADPLRQRISQVFDQFVDIQSLNDTEVAELSRRLEIDIAIDLNGYTFGARPDVFALRVAPIQISFLGYAGTSGASYMDYVVLDRFVAPPANRSFFTEQLAYLPDCFMPHDSTQTIASHPLSRNDHALPEKGFVFCCFNNHYKINPPVFNVWMRLLQKIPGSVLWLSGANTTVQDNLRKEAQARGIDGDRLVFAKRLDRMEDHLARYRLADLFIDTSPYNAHATAMDALWAGLPVLTCAGQSFASRVAGSLLTTLGLPELITYTHADYEALALELVTQPEKLIGLRDKLARQRHTSPMFDTPRFTAGLEALYQRIHAHHRAGHSPATFAN